MFKWFNAENIKEFALVWVASFGIVILLELISEWLSIPFGVLLLVGMVSMYYLQLKK